jgi:hypothetical protein
MRVFIPKGNADGFISKEIITEGSYSAFYGFSLLGWEVVFYEGNPPEGLSREDVVVGWITQVKKGLTNLGIEAPTEIDYPEELNEFYGRKLWTSTLHKIYTDESTWPVFVKPVKGKQFNGKLITKLGDLIGIGSQEDRAVWCSEPINFVSEWRCFVRYGKVVDCRRYKGDYRISPNYTVIDSAIEKFESQPAAYTLDVGIVIDKDGKQRTYVVEVNDGYAMGTYGLQPIDYAKMLSARWSELVGIPDPTRF